MGKKKFIDKKKSATFQLLSRDSSDPNYDEAPGSDRVFVRVDNNRYSVDTFFADDASADAYHGEDPNSIFADAPDDCEDGGHRDNTGFGNSMKFQWGPGGASAVEAAPLPEHVRREILGLGFPDDGYNYLIHLREIKNTGGGSAFYQNPRARFDELSRDVKAYDASRVRVSEVKADDSNDNSIYSVASRTVGVKVQKAVDPEVAAFLDDSDLSRFGSDVEDLEEDFVIRANLQEEGEEGDIDKERKLNLIDEPQLINGTKDGHVVSLEGKANTVSNTDAGKQENFPVQSRNDFVGKKPRVHRDLDVRFDALECQEYATDDEDDCGGFINAVHESLGEDLNDARKDIGVDDLELDDEYKAPADFLRGNEQPKSKESSELAADVVRRCAEYARKYENEDEDEHVTIVEESSDESEGWDCETIVSTYSNLDNHPAKIGIPETSKKKLVKTFSEALNANTHVISLHGKERLPRDFLPRGRKSTVEKAKGVPGKTQLQKRKQHGQESKDEKKERKGSVKEERREARRMKKEMKGLYRCEATRAQKVAAEAGPSAIPLM